MTIVEDLARWLGEQLDADTEEARAAAEELGPDWFYDDGLVLARREQDLVATGSQDFLEAGYGRFIAAHDPARVLREIDAKRQILDRYEELRAASKEAGLIGDVTEEYQDFLLRLLAAVYADRPGYQEAWRP